MLARHVRSPTVSYTRGGPFGRRPLYRFTYSHLHISVLMCAMPLGAGRAALW